MFRYALQLCMERGERYAPRGHGVREVPFPVVMQLSNPLRPFILSKVRKVNYRFAVAEAAWIVAGQEVVSANSPLAKMLDFSDDGKTLWGAYGPRISAQMHHVLTSLKRDRDSRQAVITTWRPEINGHATKDVPCTVAWHFQIRDEALNLTVFMRSHDAWLGLPYDVFSFTTVQRMVAGVLGVPVGRYNHVLSNLHLYDRDYEGAVKSIEEGPQDYDFELSLIKTKPESWVSVQDDFRSLLLSGEASEMLWSYAPEMLAAMWRSPEAWPWWSHVVERNGFKVKG